MAQKFTGTQKAAILLMQAGKDRASAVLRSMREQEVAEIMAEVARLHQLEVNEIEEVLNEFTEIHLARSHVAQGGYSTARELLEASFGGTKADEILDNLGVTMVAAPFEFLRTVPGLTTAAATALAGATLAQGEEALERTERLGGQVLVPDDPAYPDSFHTIAEPPAVVFLLGRAELLGRPAVAVVGSRDHTPYGADVARWLEKKSMNHG